MKKLVFATNNRNKLEEVREILKGKVEVLGLQDVGCLEDIEETGNTLEDNALIKVRYLKENYGYDCFADDTGLEVEVLNGAPGVLSARYAGEGHDSEANMLKLLQALEGKENRSARFRTVIALIIDGEEHLFEGAVDGEIITDKRGDKGFGYDPIFMARGYDKTFAELPADVKNDVSHRAMAVKKLHQYLNLY